MTCSARCTGINVQEFTSVAIIKTISFLGEIINDHSTYRQHFGNANMIPEEEIQKNLVDMGYILAKPRALYPSYYKLTDGSIIRALININYLILDPQAPQGFAVNSANSVSAFVPKEKRHPELFQQFNSAEIMRDPVDDDVEFEVLRENFSVYDLSNGMLLSVKTVVGQITKSKHYTREGEPIYNINTNPIIKAKKP